MVRSPVTVIAGLVALIPGLVPFVTDVVTAIPGSIPFVPGPVTLVCDGWLDQS